MLEKSRNDRFSTPLCFLLFLVSHELAANDFYVVTSNGIRVKIVLPTEFVFRHVTLLSIPKIEERELTGEEKDK